MRTRGLAAAVVGVMGAGLVRVLDVPDRLPGVPESEAVRTGMGPGLTGAWLLLAGGLIHSYFDKRLLKLIHA